MKLFPGYQYYPIARKGSKYYIDTEYGKFEIKEWEITCHECKKTRAFKIEKEDVPQMDELYWDRNVFKPYFYYLNGDCFHGVHGGFSRPAWKLEGGGIHQSTLEEFT